MRGCIKIYPFNFKDYYQILQVHYDASPDVIKAAYRKLCTLYHPDVSHNPNEDKRMLEINEAYNILSNPDKRTAIINNGLKTALCAQKMFILLPHSAVL